MRIEGWEGRLNKVIERSNRPFQWGSNDCCIFSAKCVEAVTGLDFWSHYAYRTAREASILIEGMGGIEAIASRFLGSQIPIKTAKRGDILTYDFGRVALGVCAGESTVFVGPYGLVDKQTLECLKSWSVD